MAKKFKTKQEAINAVIGQAEKWLGYLEKRSNARLLSKTANAGSANFTIFGKRRGCNGQPWCGAFTDDCGVQIFGKELANKIMHGLSNYTPTSAEGYKKAKKWIKPSGEPQRGDQIFFKNSQRICHTGWVYKVNSKYVFTIEGNTDPGASVIRNGGGVHRKKYERTNPRIAGYGRPSYDLAVKKTK